MSQSPDAGLLMPTDSTLARLHSQSAYQQHRPSLAPPPLVCWDPTSPLMSSPCQPAATCIKREVMQLPSNGLDDNRSSDDSWTYVSPSSVTALSYYARDNREYSLGSFIKCISFIKYRLNESADIWRICYSLRSAPSLCTSS